MPALRDEIEIVRAMPNDADALNAIAQAAKAHWGYPAAWLAQWAAVLTLTPEAIAAQETFKAIHQSSVVGFYSLRVIDGARWELDHLWVLPSRLRRGIGSALFNHAIRHAESKGARRLTIESDPHAEGFYLRMGAHRIGTITSDIDGHPRDLPLLVRELST